MKNIDKEKVKDTTWKLFSKYIRLKNSDDKGFCVCVTCGAIKFWKEMQGGHYMHNKSDYDEENVHVQCIRCNHFLSGNGIEYAKFMLKKYGPEKLELIEWRANQTCKKDLLWYLDVKKEVKEKLKKLKTTKGHLF